MLRLPDSWVWDAWYVDDGTDFHAFFLRASRALLDPDRRHWRTSIGHAVSSDLRDWQLVADALVPGDPPAFDDLATWTGSVVSDDGGAWHLFYTAAARAEHGLVQRIGHATSVDLTTWARSEHEPAVTADPRWYEQLGESVWHDQAWRDPWVFPDPNGRGWHMLITARANQGPTDDRGVVGHAHSDDLAEWAVGPPLTAPGGGFGQLEVCQVAEIDGRFVLVFSCLRTELAASRKVPGATGGIWAARAESGLGPFDINGAYPLTDDRCYAGRLVRDRGGEWQLLAFRNRGEDGAFVGEIADPIPVGWSEDGRLRLLGEPGAGGAADKP